MNARKRTDYMKQKCAEILYIDSRGFEQSLAINILIADRVFSRLKGLMGSASLPDSEALLLSPCKYIHTFFMRYPIDALFLDKDYHCVEFVKNIRPWKFGIGNLKAKYVLELASQNLMNTAILIDRVKFMK
jgi:uncharacterized membrane protein (UPF0127 family)